VIWPKTSRKRSFAKAIPVVEGPVIPVISRRLSKAADCGFYAVFKDRGEAWTPAGLRVFRGRALWWRVLASTDERRSLKTQQHAGVVSGLARASSVSSNGAVASAAIQPGSVDMLGPIRLDIAGLQRPEGHVGAATARNRRFPERGMADPGSGHR